MEEILNIKLTSTSSYREELELFNKDGDGDDAGEGEGANNNHNNNDEDNDNVSVSSANSAASAASGASQGKSSGSPKSKRWHPGRIVKKLVDKVQHIPESLSHRKTATPSQPIPDMLPPPVLKGSGMDPVATPKDADLPVTEHKASDTSASSSPVGEGPDMWYPGKYAKKVIHHHQETKRAKMLKESEMAEEKRLGEISHDNSDGSRRIRVRNEGSRSNVATVTVRNLAARNLHSWTARKYYCYVALEDKRVQTELLKKSLNDPNSGSKVWNWTEEVKFDISDINSDLRICLYCSKPFAGKDFCVGTVIIPLANIIPYLEMQATSKAWYELYPLPPTELYYTPVVIGMPGAAGLDRPNESLGQIFVEVNVKLQESDLLSLLLTSPFRNVNPKIPENPDPQYIKGAINRILVALNPPHFMAILADLVAWKSAYASTFALLVWSHLTLLCPFWLYPLMFAIIACGFGLASRGTQDRSHVFAFNDPDLPNTVPKKLKMIKKLLIGLQKLVNVIATSLERSGNALNWSDERVSLAMSIFVLGAGLTCSLIALGWSFITYFIPVRRIFFAVGLIAMLPPNRLIENKLEGIVGRLAKRRKLSDISKPNKGLEKLGENDGNEQQQQDKPDYSAAPVVPVADPVASNESSTMKVMLRNLFSRIPDEREISHRIIARSQVVEIVN